MTILKRRICIEAKHLNKNVNQHLKDKLIQLTENTCSEENGFLVVKKITKILENEISPANSEVIFTVEYEAETLKPEIGMELEGPVKAVFDHAIIVEITKNLRAVVPYANLQDYKIEKPSVNKIDWYYMKDGNRIGMDTIVKVKLTGTKYIKNSFTCFGELVEL